MVRVLTEFMAMVMVSLVAGCFMVAVTTQHPHPPSWHMTFVPVRCRYSRRYLLRVVSGVKSEALTEII